MKNKIEIAWHGFDKSKKAIERLRNLVRIKAKNLRDLTLEGYQAGEIGLLSLLELKGHF